MNRRELLKLSLLAPLAGLFKGKTKPRRAFIKHGSGGGSTEVSPTTGTSSDTTVMEFPYQFITPPEEKWVKIDPTSIWAKETGKAYQKAMDDAIIEALT